MAIARAPANEPRVILAIEPTGNLDSETGEGIIALLVAPSETSGQTVVLITHDQAIAERAGRVVGMRDGRLHHDSAATTTVPLAGDDRP